LTHSKRTNPQSKNPLVSVVIPAFNAERYVSEAIDSILTQTLTDFELIVVDDGSIDNTPSVLADYATRDNRIVVRRLTNSGVATSMNVGCELARGKYIARMDADDRCEARRLALQVDLLERRPDIAICGTGMFALEAGKQIALRFPTDPDIAKSTLPFQLSVAGASIMFSRDWYLSCGVKHDSTVGATDDYLFIVECSTHSRFMSLSQPLYFYRTHQEQVTRRESDKQQKFTRQIRLLQLNRLGLEPTEEELNTHEAISDWRLQGDEKTIDAAHNWLIKMKVANSIRSLYPEPAFSSVLGNYWFALCLRHSALGLRIYRQFSKSPLSRKTLFSLDRLKILAKSVAGQAGSDNQPGASQVLNGGH
jgi:glycosyltransferase involved in cell wall biosynthesis